MARRLVLVALFVAVSACTQSPSPSPSPSGPGGPLWFSFAEPATLPPAGDDGYGSEPSVLAASDGTMYAVAVLGSVPPLDPADGAGYVQDRRGDAVWKSLDGGARWTFESKPDFPFGGGDADLDEDAAGTLYLAGQWRPAAFPAPAPSLYLAGESMSVSTDEGRTWRTFPVASEAYVTDRQWTATSGTGTAYFAFNQDPLGLTLTKTTDSGMTWKPLGSIAGTEGPNGIPADLLVDAKDGRLYVPYGPGIGGGSNQHRLFTSDDGGATFQAKTIRTAPSGVQAGAIFGSLDMDSNGALYYVWAEGQKGGKGVTVYLTVSTNHGDAWTKPVPVTSANVTAVFPWIAVGAPGHVAVVYYGANGTFLSDDAPAETDWYPYAALSRNALNVTPTFDAVRLQATPNHRGPLCTGGTGCDPQYRQLGDFFEVDVTPTGKAFAVWADDASGPRTNKVAVMSMGELR